MKQSDKKRKSIHDRLTYAYIRKIKKWMFCPSCQDGKMRIDNKSTTWTCEKCGYTLSSDEFENDYVFWFCDECNAYLNNQEGFDKFSPKHICRKCGYENDTTFDNAKGICSDCGKIILDPNTTLCFDCKQKRKEKTQENLKTFVQVAEVVAEVIGAVVLAAQTANDNDETDYAPLPNSNEERAAELRHSYSDSWFKTASLEELQTERDRVQADYLNPDLDINYRGDLYDMLPKFDNAIGDRQWAGKEPGYPTKSEHGWHLPSDDD